MLSIVTKEDQDELLKKQALNRLNRSKLAERLNLSRSTVKTVLDSETPLVVNHKTFTAVNNYLLEDL